MNSFRIRCDFESDSEGATLDPIGVCSWRRSARLAASAESGDESGPGAEGVGEGDGSEGAECGGNERVGWHTCGDEGTGGGTLMRVC